jgi:hypothetical protein
MYAKAMESLTELRVRYAETDAMGIVHHGAPSARPKQERRPIGAPATTHRARSRMDRVIASAAQRKREDSAGRCPIWG